MYKIYTIEKKAEEKFLRKRAVDFDFSKFSKKEINDLIKNMRQTMKNAVPFGIGLSANQVGLDMRVFVAEIPQKGKKPKLYAIFNPEIVKKSEEKAVLEEGCLSVPGIWGNVERPAKITLAGFDKNQKKINFKVFGVLAAVFQHEVDHLNGVLFIDKAKETHKSAPEETAPEI